MNELDELNRDSISKDELPMSGYITTYDNEANWE